MKNTVIETIAATSVITEAAFGPEAILAPYVSQIRSLRAYTKEDLQNPETMQNARQQYAELKAQLLADLNKPFTVIRRQDQPTRLNRSLASDIFGIEYDNA